MPELPVHKQIDTIKRFLRFAYPHWKFMLVAFIAMSVTSMVSGSLLLLGRPIFEGLAKNHGQTKAERTKEETPSAAEKGAKDPTVNALERRLNKYKEQIIEKVSKVGFVKWLKDFVGPGPMQLTNVAIVVLVLIAPLWIIASFLETYCTRRVLWSVMAEIRVAVFDKLSRQPLAFFASRRTGDLISRLTNDISTTKSSAKMIFRDVAKHPIQIVVLLGVAFFSSWRLTLLVLVALPVVAMVMRLFGGRIQKHGRKSLEKLGDITDAINQMFSGIRVVKSFGMEEEEIAEFQERNRQQLRQAFKLTRSRAWADSLPHAIMAVCFAVVLLVADYFRRSGDIQFATLIPLIGAVALMPRSVKKLAKVYSKLRENLAAFDRIFELLDQESSLKDAPDAVAIDTVEESVCFDNVWFAYEDDQYVLRDINLEVSHGEVCALVGETGAGKSTLLDLIPRFYDPQEGSVLLDGHNLKKVTRDSLLAQVAIVGQHPFLFNRSVAENIRYGQRNATVEEVHSAAQAAQIHDFVSSLPDGYETIVGEKGARFSGGQRQCITIARAILKDAPILILDEATSNLDSESERRVQRGLNNLMTGRTTFVIAHRLSTVRFADRIVVLKEGRIVERGTHDKLLDKGGEYAKLHRIQFSEPKPQNIDDGQLER